MSKTLKGALSLVLVGILAIGTSAPVQASVKIFKSCSTLNLKFKGGVSRHPQLNFDPAGLHFQPKYNDRVYKAHRKLDFDRDGIVCEVTVADVAHKQVLTQLKKSPEASESFLIIRSGPSVKNDSLAVVKKSVLTAMQLFGPMFPVEPVNATWFTSADVDWVDSAIAEAGAYPKNYSNNLRNFANQCNMGNAGIGDNGPYINQCLGPSGAPAHHNYEGGAHEYFHTIQYSSMGGQRLPYWFLEGGATFVGIHLGGHLFEDFSTSRKLTLGRYASRGLDQMAKEAVSKSDVSAIVNRLVALENHNPEQGIRQSAYVFGMLLTEKLVADYGFTQWVAFLTALDANGFERAFSDTYKLSVRDFYLKSAPYIASQLKLSNFGF